MKRLFLTLLMILMTLLIYADNYKIIEVASGIKKDNSVEYYWTEWKTLKDIMVLTVLSDRIKISNKAGTELMITHGEVRESGAWYDCVDQRGEQCLVWLRPIKGTRYMELYLY